MYYGNLEDEEELVNRLSFKTNKNDDLPPYSEADPYCEEPPEYSAAASNDEQTTTITTDNVNN